MSLGSPTSVEVSSGGSTCSIVNIIHHGEVFGFVVETRASLGRTWRLQRKAADVFDPLRWSRNPSSSTQPTSTLSFELS
jgi:hypothetical protein